jgi:3D (Asp-Asp-Asp) domain-containing protein
MTPTRKDIRKRNARVEIGRVLLVAAGLVLTAWGDIPDPAAPGRPPRIVSSDRPDVGDYTHGPKLVDLLPTLEVIVTGYSLDPGETDDTPDRTAINTTTRPGVIALSRDLIRAFNPTAPFRFGDKVRIEGIGEFIVEDTMAERWNRRADIWFPTSDEAVRWGRKRLAITRVETDGASSGSVHREASAPSK